jgi:peptidoglycan/xylan/chitin deacetylase (PgdA/CDA1 family)
MNSSYKKKLFITKIYKIFRDNENSFRTLMYHSIFDDKINVESNSLWKLSLSLFKKQIDYLKKDKRKMIFKSETLLNDCPINGISITFDDGYEDTYKFAAPYLIENNIPFTIFPITNYIKNKTKGFMNEFMLKELSKNNLVTIGSHSMNHKKLTELDDKLIFNELYYSKSYLEDLLGKEIITLSYPHGKFNKKIKEKVYHTGYKLAFSSKFNSNKKNEDKLSLSRSEVWNSDIIEVFNQKLKGNWDWLKYRLV